MLRSNESEADDLSLRSPKSSSPYLVLLPSADSNCMNVSSNRPCCKRSYRCSAAYLLPLLSKLSHNSFNCMLTVSSRNVIRDRSIWKKSYLIFFLLTHKISSSKCVFFLRKGHRIDDDISKCCKTSSSHHNQNINHTVSPYLFTSLKMIIDTDGLLPLPGSSQML